MKDICYALHMSETGFCALTIPRFRIQATSRTAVGGDLWSGLRCGSRCRSIPVFFSGCTTTDENAGCYQMTAQFTQPWVFCGTSEKSRSLLVRPGPASDYERRLPMNRSLTAAVLGMAALASLPLRADSPYAEGKQCTLSTLRGIYLLTARLDAPSYAQVPGVPQVVGGLRTFDGAGNISGPATVNAGGVIAQGVRAPGVYMLNADCTGESLSFRGLTYAAFFSSVRPEPTVIPGYQRPNASSRSSFSTRVRTCRSSWAPRSDQRIC